MKFINFLTITLLLGITTSCFAQTNVERVDKKMKEDKPLPVRAKIDKQTHKTTNLKVLAKGGYSGIEEPFIFAVRDENSLEKLVNFPLNKIEIKEEVDFEKNMVIAAFAGTKRTGGFSVEINKKGNELSILLDAPSKDAMVTQALTQPFAIVLVPIDAGESLKFKIAETWKSKSQNYQVKNGSVEFSGGIAGVIKKYVPQGTIELYRLGNFSTMILDLKGSGKDSDRSLSEIVSGEIIDNCLQVENINGGTLIESPHPPMNFRANFSDAKISIKLSAEGASDVRDGFSGKGTLEAQKIVDNK